MCHVLSPPPHLPFCPKLYCYSLRKLEKLWKSGKLKREETINEDLSATNSLGHTVVLIIGGTVVYIVIPWQSYGQPGISWAL